MPKQKSQIPRSKLTDTQYESYVLTIAKSHIDHLNLTELGPLSICCYCSKKQVRPQQGSACNFCRFAYKYFSEKYHGTRVPRVLVKASLHIALEDLRIPRRLDVGLCVRKFSNNK